MTITQNYKNEPIFNIDLYQLNENERTEAERIISTSTGNMLMRCFSNEDYLMLSLTEEVKPFFRDLVKIITGYELVSGGEHQAYFHMKADENGDPYFNLEICEDLKTVLVTKSFRFTNVVDLYNIYYKRSYMSLKTKLNGEADIEMYANPDFKTCLGASVLKHSVHFGVYLS